MTSAEPVDVAAGDWLARRESGEWTPEDEAHFQAWLTASPRHRVAYLRIEHVWEHAERLRALKLGGPSPQVPPPGRWALSPFFRLRNAARESDEPPRSTRGRGFRLRRRLAWSIGIGLAAGAALSALWLLWPQAAFYRTPVGGLESVPIADGSTVTLNTDTAVHILITDKTRRVKLDHGEAFFQVAKDPNRPFVVEVGKRRVMAVGTQFSVRREGSDIQVIVTEGAVRLTHAQLTEELLPAGAVAHAGESGVLVKQGSRTAAEEQLSWRQGVLHFREVTLAEAAAEFNRYNIRQVVIEDPTAADYLVAGDFRATNVEAFVRLLQRGYPIKVKQQANRLVLQSR